MTGHIRKTLDLLIVLFVLLALFASKKSKNRESMECLEKAKSFTFCVLFSYFFTTTLLFALRLDVLLLLVKQALLLSLVVLF